MTGPTSPMSPHCCDSKLMNEMSHGYYGQSANYCSATFVQGTATLAFPMQNGTASATFQHYPQSGDSLIVGCLGNGFGGSFTATDNQTINPGNNYTTAASAFVSPPLLEGGEAYLLQAQQIVYPENTPGQYM
jgi:hypothetical protein